MILAKSKRSIRKQPINENAENLEAPTTKKRKQINVEVASSSKPKPKPRAAKKKPDVHNDMKDKVNNKAKAVMNNDNETESDGKSGDDKFTKITAPRKTRGRKNEPNSDDTNNDETTEKLSSLETVDTNNESEEADNNRNNESELAQTVKKGRNVKKKEAPQKKPAKTRGKANENVTDITKVIKETQKKTNKETIVTIKKGRGKVIENVTEEKKVLNSSETLSSNNNIQKLLEDNDKKEDAEKEETKNTKTLGMSKKIDEMIIKDEIDESNEISSSVEKEN